jgi:hypothetical protein
VLQQQQPAGNDEKMVLGLNVYNVHNETKDVGAIFSFYILRVRNVDTERIHNLI